MKTIKLEDTSAWNDIKHAIVKPSIMPSAFPTLYLSFNSNLFVEYNFAGNFG